MKRLLISMLGLLTIVSCVKNEIAQGLTYENDPKSVYVSADMLSTKATIGDTFEYGDRFAIKSLSTNIAESYRFAEYRYNNEIWERISGQYMHWDSGNNSFQAWYPSSASYDSFTLPTDQSNFDRLCSADWMTAEVENIKQTSDNKIDLHFRHRLAIIRVVITSDSYMSTCKFYTSDKREILSYIDSYFPYKESCAIVLLTPGQYSEGSTFMTITKDDYEIDVKVPSGGLILEEGKSYNFTLSITEKNAQIADVVINDWNTSVLDQVIAIEEFSGVKVPDNEIWYVTTDGSIHSPGYISEYGDYYFRYGSGAFTPFDAEIVSNTYENGKGVIKFSSTVTYINYYAFEGTRIKEIYLPDSIQNLDFYSISNTGIKTFRVPANINHSVNQFCSNRNLESFTGSFVSEDGRCLIIDNKLTTFAPKDIDIYNTPSGVEVIGVYAFANNSELEQITISEGVREIEHSAFEDCSKLKKIFFPSTLIKIEYNFWKCTELEGFYGNETFHTPDNKGLIYKDSKGFTHMSQFAGKGITEYTIPDGIYSVSFSYYAKDLKVLLSQIL